MTEKPLEQEVNDWNANAIDVILHKVTKIDTLVDNHRRMEESIAKMADAVARLAVIEDRQNSDREWVKDIASGNKEFAARIHERLDKLDSRLDTIEKSEVDNRRARNIVFGLLGVMGMAVAVTLLRLIGLSA